MSIGAPVAAFCQHLPTLCQDPAHRLLIFRGHPVTQARCAGQPRERPGGVRAEDRDPVGPGSDPDGDLGRTQEGNGSDLAGFTSSQPVRGAQARLSMPPAQLAAQLAAKMPAPAQLAAHWRHNCATGGMATQLGGTAAQSGGTAAQLGGMAAQSGGKDASGATVAAHHDRLAAHWRHSIAAWRHSGGTVWRQGGTAGGEIDVISMQYQHRPVESFSALI
eukprot:gene13050-biopygen6521